MALSLLFYGGILLLLTQVNADGRIRGIDMRYMLFALVAACGLVVLWLFTARSLSLLLDRIHRITLESQSPDHFVFDNGELIFDAYRLSLMSLDYQFPAKLAIGMTGRVSIVDGAKSFPFGPGRSTPNKSGLQFYEFTADAGDTVRFTYEQSLLSWWIFEPNWMTGVAPSWRRHIYCRLRWTKRSGAKLELVWRGDQDYFKWEDRGWYPKKFYGMPNMLSIDIEPAWDLERAATQYLIRTKHWEPSEYKLESRGPSSDGKEEVLFAFHRSDEKSPIPGAGHSVELRLAYDTRAVTREIAGQ